MAQIELVVVGIERTTGGYFDVFANVNVALEAGGWEVVKKYVELGLGVSIVTDVCLTESDRVAKIPLNEYFPQRSYGIVLRKGKFLSPQAKRFITMMDPEFLV